MPWLDQQCIDQLAHHIRELASVLKAVNRVDLIRFHIEDLYGPLSRHQSIVRVTILHERLDIPNLVPLYQEFPETPAISIANAQREPLPWLLWQGRD